MTQKNVMKPDLWTPRPVDETIAVYADWAETYDKDVRDRGYHTPERIAAALKAHADPDTLILDFGCGTGLGGAALRAAGFNRLHGTDVTAEMLEKATARGVYAKTWLSKPGQHDFAPGSYKVIVASGVISLAAAPPETLAPIVDQLTNGDLLVMSYNDPTLADQSYVDALEAEIQNARLKTLFREHGPHLDDVDMGADVMVLQRL